MRNLSGKAIGMRFVKNGTKTPGKVKAKLDVTLKKNPMRRISPKRVA